MQKKVKFRSKELIINEKNMGELPSPIADFLLKYYNSSPFITAHTSGSTGKPRPVKLQKEHMRASARKTLYFLGLKAGDRALLCLSPGHIAGMMMLVRWLEGGLDLYPVEISKTPLANLKGEFEFAAMVPYQVYHSLEQIHRIDKLIIGGGALNPELEEKLSNQDNSIYHSYGMTETLSHVALRQISPANEEYFQGMDGVSLKRDERNCLVIDAPDIGVKNLLTNDVVELIDEKCFTWLGRYDNVVNSGGLKLHPENIEGKIGSVGVNYFLAGIPDQALGQKLVMIIETGQNWEEANLEPYFKNLRSYEKPKEILRLPAFLYTDNGKLKRAATLKKAKLHADTADNR